MGSDDAASLSYPHAVGVVVGECGEGRGGDGGVVGGGTLTDGGEYLGPGRFVRHFLQPIVALLRVFSSGLMGTDDAASRSYPRASRARRLVAIDGRFAVSGAPSMGDGPGQTW